MSNDIRIGLVGLFDVLGYQNILERNEPEFIAEKVMPVMLNVDSDVNNTLNEVLDKPRSAGEKLWEVAAQVTKKIEWLVFSDTILIVLQVDSAKSIMTGDHARSHSVHWLIFVSTCNILQRKLFEAGLPLRGAIDFGKYYIKKSCFAGRPIVNAYQISSQLELSAAVLCSEADQEYRMIFEKCNEFGVPTYPLFIEYLIPLKNEEKYLLTERARVYDPKGLDIRSQVMRAFWGNGKDIPRSVQQKVNNTEQWLEFLKRNIES
jgi:hypothetical protein